MATQEEIAALQVEIKEAITREGQQVVAKVGKAVADAIAPLEQRIAELEASNPDLQAIADGLREIKQEVEAIVEDVTVEPEPEDPTEPLEPSF